MLALSEWLSTFAFSRRVKHLPRDFSDAVLLAELLAQLLPAGAVQLHNYPPTSRFQQKLVNWETLNCKVLTPLRCELPHSLLEELAAASPSAIALALVQVKKTIDQQTNLRAPRSPTKATTPPSPPSPTKSMTASPPPSPLAATVSIPRANTTSKTRAMSAGTDMLTAKAASSPQRQLRPPRPTKRSVSSPTRTSQSLLRDFLPLPQDRPSPDAIASTFSRVLRTAETLSPKSKPPRSGERLRTKLNSGETVETLSRSSTCDSSDAEDSQSPRGQLNITSPKKEASVEVQRREWPTYARPQSPPGRFTTTELTRHKLSSISIITEQESEVLGDTESGSPTTPTDPISVAPTAGDSVLVELCASPPTVFPRVVVDVDTVLSSLPVRFQRKLKSM